MLEIRNLRKSYRSKNKEVKAVNGVSFNVEKGEIFGLLGPNGAGKTTTVKMVCGLVTPDEGEVTVNGLSVRKNLVKALANIGAVLEGARNVYWRLTARENVMLFAGRRKIKSRDSKERTSELLRLLELEEKSEVPVRKLSRGMQQKVVLACALVGNPSLLLLDEPTLGLDVMSAEVVKKEVKRLKTAGKSILLTTHDMKVAEELCDRVAIIDHGKILVIDSVESLKETFSEERYTFVLRGEKTRELFPDAKEDGGRYTIEMDIRSSAELYEGIERMKNGNLEILNMKKSEIDLKDVFTKTLAGSGR